MAADEPPVGRQLRVLTWNVAAVNNNPFEYFITHVDPAYNDLMADVEAFIDSPGERDIAVGEIITDTMFDELCALMETHGFQGVEQTREYWFGHVKDRKIVSQFLKDKDIGAKRLCSMPDRVTNTLRSGDDTLYRPTIINCYETEMPSTQSWWEQWKQYMFSTSATVATKSGDAESKTICELLDPIKKSKYPAITSEEELISIPLQLACMAVFDGILVHVVNLLAPGKWHDVKSEMVQSLNKNKTKRTLEILASPVYASCDCLLIQEAAAAFVGDLTKHDILSSKYHILVPEKLDGKRDQNSLVLASKERFLIDDEGWSGEVTDFITNLIAKDAPAGVAPGDLFAVKCVDKQHVDSADSGRCVLASFHGDTNGLATVPVMDAVDKFVKLLDVNQPTPSDDNGLPRVPPTLVFGLDANTHVEHSAGKKQGVEDFCTHLEVISLVSCWGPQPDPNCHTTYNARTYLQPQLNKAVKMCEMQTCALTDKHPKDHIVFGGDKFSRVQIVMRDNTGDGTFVEDAPFPTLSFPSDHALVCATLCE